MEEKVIDIKDLVQDDKNLNKGTEEGRALMEQSFKELGAGRSILIDRDNNIIAGNHTAQAAMSTGIKKVRVVETEGDVLVAVRRTDVSLDSTEGRNLALIDNASHSVNMSWDDVVLADLSETLGMDEMQEWGFALHEPSTEDTDVSVVETEGDFCLCPKCGFRWKRK